MKLSLSLLLLAAATSAAEPAKPATKAAAKPTATKAAPTPEQLAAAARVQAMQEMVNAARRFPAATPEAKAFFDQLRAQRAAAADPEARAALDQALAMDPAVAVRLPLGEAPVKAVELPAGTTSETKLAELERQLDLGQPPRALSAAELVPLAAGEDFAAALRAVLREDLENGARRYRTPPKPVDGVAIPEISKLRTAPASWLDSITGDPRPGGRDVSRVRARLVRGAGRAQESHQGRAARLLQHRARAAARRPVGLRRAVRRRRVARRVRVEDVALVHAQLPGRGDGVRR